METPIRFRIRPGYKSKLLLAEFCGDNHAEDFPDVANILQRALQATPTKHPGIDTVRLALATDELISFWTYAQGSYQVDHDTWGLFIHADDNNARVMADIEGALLDSGQFIKEEVDFSDYA